MKSSFELLVASAAALLLACCQSAPGDTHADVSPFHCAACHTPEFNSTTRPPHAGARPETCGVCHSQSSWGHARIEHPWWALSGAHGRAAADKSLAGTENHVKCFWCHRGIPAQFSDTPRDCNGCHAEDRQGVKFPGHDGFSSNCETCHSTEAWKPAQLPAIAAPAATPSARAVPPPKPPRAPRAVPARSSPPQPVVVAPAWPQPVAVPPKPVPTPTPAPTPAPVPDITSRASRRR